MTGDEIYNKELYSEYMQYFETAATNLIEIGHSPTHRAFVRSNFIDAFEAEQLDLKGLVLMVEPPYYTLGGLETGENLHHVWEGAFSILIECRENDIAAQYAACDKALKLVRKVLGKMVKDRKTRRLFDCQLLGTTGNPVAQMFRNRYGFRQTIKMSSQFGLMLDPADWQNEPFIQAPPPFATVVDGSNLITLQAGQTHTCAVPTPGTVTVKNSDLSYSEQVTAPSSTDTPHELPDVDHTDTDGSTVTLPGMTPMVCSAPAPATIGLNRRTTAEELTVASGADVDLEIVNAANQQLGSRSSLLKWLIGAQPLQVNGAQAVNIQPTPGQTPFNLKVKLNGSAAGVFDGTDTVNITQSLTSTTKSAASSPLYSGTATPSSDLILPTVKVLDRFGVEYSREYRPGTTSNIWEESSIDVYEFLPATNLLCAIGTKQMLSGWAGNLLRFRKSTGGTEFNVGYTTNGYPDVATAQTNLGADAGFVVRAYDQGGNSRDAYWTSSTAPQPRLGMAAGMRGKQVHVAHILNQYMQCDCPITAGQTNTLYMACLPVEMAGAWMLCGGTGSTFKWWLNTDSLNRVYLYDGVSQNPVTSNYSVVQRAPMVIAIQFKTNSLRVYVNGTLVLSHNTWSVLASSMFQIGRRVDGGGSIGQFNWNGIALYAADYDATIMTKMCNMFLR